MRKNIYTIVVVLAFCFSNAVLAQNNKQAEAIVDKLLTTVKNEAVDADFQLTIAEKSLPKPQVLKGKFTLKGNKFCMETDGIAVFFNGKTQWVYMEDNEEVMLTEPSPSELGDINQMAILSNFRTGSIIRFVAKAPADGNHHIEMIPTAVNSDIAKIELALNKTSENVVYINQTNKNGSSMKLQLSNFRKGVKVSDRIFVFDKSKYPNVEINDLR